MRFQLFAIGRTNELAAKPRLKIGPREFKGTVDGFAGPEHHAAAAPIRVTVVPA